MGVIRGLCSILMLGAAVLLVATLSGCQPSQSLTKPIVLYGFSITENVLKEEIIPAFQKDWKDKTGQEVRFITSFAGSGTITNQIVFGAPAQIAMVSTELDAVGIKKAGLVTTDWRSFKNWEHLQIKYTPAEIGRLSLFLPRTIEGLSAIDKLNEAGLLVYQDDNYIYMQPIKARSFYQYLQQLYKIVRES